MTDEIDTASEEVEPKSEIRERLAGTIERRDFTTEDVEIREASDGKLKFSGYASTSETPYSVGGF